MAIDLRLNQDAAVWGPSPAKPFHQTQEVKQKLELYSYRLSVQGNEYQCSKAIWEIDKSILYPPSLSLGVWYLSSSFVRRLSSPQSQRPSWQ